jgi:endonuclease/exonuclease/phosphatase family metal-dependent hydrolase
MSFNVLAPVWLDSEIIKQSTPVNRSANQRMTKASEVIKRRRPDILFLQEVTTVLLSKLNKLYDVYCLKHTQAGDNPFTAILVKKDFPITDIKCLKSRSKSSVMKAKINNKPVVLASIHLAYNNNPLARKQLKDFLDDLKPMRKDTTYILAGDFNMDNDKFHDQITAPLGYEPIILASKTHPNESETEMSISKFFLKGGGSKVHSSSVGYAKDLRETIKRYGSDHFPIYALVEI